MPTWGPIGQEVYERTYSRTLHDGRQETWPETVERVVDGNLALAGGHEPGEREALIDLFLEMKALPAGRHLWASGADTSLGLYNCHRAGWDETLSGHGMFTFDQLMLGGGVGANYSAEYLSLSPRINRLVNLTSLIDDGHPDRAECDLAESNAGSRSSVLHVQDSREGWASALAVLIEAHVSGPSSIYIDFSGVRPRGSLIKGFGGTASGPSPLVSMLPQVNDILNETLGSHLSPLDAMEIDHAIASCVVAGNVRRSARMSILHWADPSIFEFIQCKQDPSKHWSTNISVEVDDRFFLELKAGDDHARTVLKLATEGMVSNGEPGFYNSSLASVGESGDVRATNPCGEIGLEQWEQCCLGHVNLSAFASQPEEASEAFRLITRYLVRATFAKSSDDRQEVVKSRNRRLGVGFFGFHDWAALHGVTYAEIPDSAVLRGLLLGFKATVDIEAATYSAELGIPTPTKTTTVAPTGSIAKLPGVSEGLQPPFARYFTRRVRYSDTDPKLQGFRDLGYPMEPCLYTPLTTVVSFTCREAVLDKVADHLVTQSDEVSLVEYFRVQRFVQDNWANNAVSVTANFDRGSYSAEVIADLLREHLPLVKGWTAMPEDGRPQSPYERLTADQYNASSLQSVGQAIDDCAAGACPIR